VTRIHKLAGSSIHVIVDHGGKIFELPFHSLECTIANLHVPLRGDDALARREGKGHPGSWFPDLNKDRTICFRGEYIEIVIVTDTHYDAPAGYTCYDRGS
jgi:hypothetical protein